jgi:LmbE family N-acetylglucosaminyl deacetylase
MIELTLGRPADRPLSVLALGAHSDDIEIGCGGTLLRLLQSDDEVRVHWVVLSASGERGGEALRSAEAYLAAGGDDHEIVIETFRDGFLPYSGAAVKDVFERLKAELAPDLILTHARDDLHQDHRLVCELTWNTWRDHLVIEYEVPKYDGDLGAPNVFVPLDEATLDRKIALLEEHFRSQAGKHWFDGELFRALPRLRGMESASPTGLAEAFYGRKLRLS